MEFREGRQKKRSCSLEHMVALSGTPLYGTFQEMGPNIQSALRVLNSVAEWPNCGAIQTS